MMIRLARWPLALLLVLVTAAAKMVPAQVGKDSPRRTILSIHVVDIQQDGSVLRKEVPVLSYERDDIKQPPGTVREGGNARIGVSSTGRVDVLWNTPRWSLLSEGLLEEWKHGTSQWCIGRDLDGPLACRSFPMELAAPDMDLVYVANDQPILVHKTPFACPPSQFSFLINHQHRERQLLYAAGDSSSLTHYSPLVWGNDLVMLWEEQSESFLHWVTSRVRWARIPVSEVLSGKQLSAKTLASNAYEPRITAVEGRDIYASYIQVAGRKAHWRFCELVGKDWRDLASPTVGDLAWVRMGSAGQKVVFVYALREDCVLDKSFGIVTTPRFRVARFRFYTKNSGFSAEKKLNMRPVGISSSVQLLTLGETAYLLWRDDTGWGNSRLFRARRLIGDGWSSEAEVFDRSRIPRDGINLEVWPGDARVDRLGRLLVLGVHYEYK
jgi:hypothetical protein